MERRTMSMVGNQVKYSNSPVYTATGNGSTVAHTLTWTAGTVNALIVSLSGVIQRPTTDYTVSGTTLTFTAAPPNGVPILVVGLDVAGVLTIPADASVTSAKIAEPLTLTAAVLAGTTNLSGGQIAFPAVQVPSANANTLDDYEEGSWTPTQGAGLTVVGAFSSAGAYTKIGRTVIAAGRVTGATSVAISIAGTVLCGALPFTTGSLNGVGSVTNSNYVATNLLTSGPDVFSGSIAASGSIYFTVTYQV